MTGWPCSDGGMGSGPHVAHVYSDFLPVEELFNFSTAVVRIFDRYGERKQRMKARMKFLVQTMGWEKFRAEVDAERKIIDQELTDLQLATEVAELDDRVREARRQIQAGLAATLAVAGRRR